MGEIIKGITITLYKDIASSLLAVQDESHADQSDSYSNLLCHATV